MTLVGVMLYVALGLIVGLPFALTISPTKAVVVLVIYILVHQIEANIISPLVMARAVRLHPAAIAIGVVAVGEVFGLLGLIIAVPILSSISILVDVLWIAQRR
jgi:predicted PurR-regulated permease PerM